MVLYSDRGTDFFVTKHGHIRVNKSDAALSSYACRPVGKAAVKHLGVND